jgi:hypothetical protein
VVQRRKKDGTLQNVSAPIVSDLYNKFMFGVEKSCPYKSHGFSQQDAWKGL